MLFVHTHLPDGTTVPHRADGLMDIGRFEESRDVLRRRAEADGGTLDSRDADREWARRVAGRARWDAAYQEWYAAGAPTGGHPGGLNEYMEAWP